MRFLDRIFRRRARGLLWSTDDPEQLATAAEAFLRAGGTLRLEDVPRLRLSERKALLLAGERVWAAREAAVLKAAGEDEAAARLLAPFDDGLALQHAQAVRELMALPRLEGEEG